MHAVTPWNRETLQAIHSLQAGPIIRANDFNVITANRNKHNHDGFHANGVARPPQREQLSRQSANRTGQVTGNQPMGEEDLPGTCYDWSRQFVQDKFDLTCPGDRIKVWGVEWCHLAGRTDHSTIVCLEEWKQHRAKARKMFTSKVSCAEDACEVLLPFKRTFAGTMTSREVYHASTPLTRSTWRLDRLRGSLMLYDELKSVGFSFLRW